MDDKTVIFLGEEICFSFSELRRVEGSYESSNDNNAVTKINIPNRIAAEHHDTGRRQEQGTGRSQ